MTLGQIIKHLWKYRKGKPLELVASACPVCICGEPITDPAGALTFEGELFHDAGCLMLIPSILRQPGRLQAGVKP